LARAAIVADASPLIALARIDRLELLGQLFDPVLVPRSVADECTVELHRPGAKAIHAALADGRLQAREVEGGQLLAELGQLLDEGEAEALVLAKDTGFLLLIDERRGRAVAAEMDLQILGTGGLLIAAKQSGHVSEVAPLLAALRSGGYRLSDRLVDAILRRCDERTP
jgi:predicted nucleic acid-binding protein